MFAVHRRSAAPSRIDRRRPMLLLCCVFIFRGPRSRLLDDPSNSRAVLSSPWIGRWRRQSDAAARPPSESATPPASPAECARRDPAVCLRRSSLIARWLATPAHACARLPCTRIRNGSNAAHAHLTQNVRGLTTDGRTACRPAVSDVRQHQRQEILAVTGEEIAVVTARHAQEAGAPNGARDAFAHPERYDFVGISVNNRRRHGNFG